MQFQPVCPGLAWCRYCPQHDPLLELLTAREQLAMYATLKVSGPYSLT